MDPQRADYRPVRVLATYNDKGPKPLWLSPEKLLYARLKGNVVFRDAPRRRAERRFRLLAPAAGACASQHLHGIGDDVGGVELHPVLFVGPVLNSTLKINLFPLSEVLTADFRQFAPGRHPVPVGTLLHVALAVLKFIGSGYSELAHRGPAGGVAHLRVGPQVPHQNN